MYVVKDLAECWEQCPKADDLDIVPAPAYDRDRLPMRYQVSTADGICFPAENEER
ncbi:MAG: hypothetical protein WDO73_23965 [Ignavibacteriota bacterium]